MDLKKLIMSSNLAIKEENIIFYEPMKKYTTYKIGGPAECLIKVYTMNELKEVIDFAKEKSIKLTVIGNGSNILVLDSGIKGIVVLNRIEEIDIIKKDNNIEARVGAGTKISKLARKLLENDITGFEELSGIPGTIGGTVIMNAGVHGKEMKDITKTVKCIDYNGKEYEFEKQELDFKYRDSKLKNSKYIVTEATLLFKQGKHDEIQSKMDEYKKYRREKQPIEYPSAGSTFKRGEDFITAKLIDDAGLKGYKIGGAEVSTKHSGFVINTGEATAKDVLQLIDYIKKEVKSKFNKNIEIEIEVIGDK